MYENVKRHDILELKKYQYIKGVNRANLRCYLVLSAGFLATSVLSGAIINEESLKYTISGLSLLGSGNFAYQSLKSGQNIKECQKIVKYIKGKE